MEETFYTALGVETDADEATVRAAYREAVKEHHPDVSDDPEAEQQFKRLTTARDVLLDPDERVRYDRIGHDAYVAEHLEAPTWSGTDPGETAGRDGPVSRGGGAGETGDGPDAADRRRARAAERAAWLGDDATVAAGDERDPTPGSRRHRASTGRRKHVRADADAAGAQHHGEATATGPDVDEPWQSASDTYTRSEAASRAAAEKSEQTTLGEMVSALGPWLVIHVVFIASAVATAVFALTEATAYIRLSLPAFLLGLLLFGLVIGLSVLHLVSQVVS